MRRDTPYRAGGEQAVREQVAGGNDIRSADGRPRRRRPFVPPSRPEPFEPANVRLLVQYTLVLEGMQ